MPIYVVHEVFDRSPEELILLEESRKSLKDTRKASIEASRKASLFNEQAPVGSVSFASEPAEVLPQAEVEE